MSNEQLVCCVCEKPIVTSDYHWTHDRSCPNFGLTEFLGNKDQEPSPCTCDLVAHAGCCPECNPKEGTMITAPLTQRDNLSDPFDCEYCDGAIATGSVCYTMNGGWYCSARCAELDNAPAGRPYYRNGDELRLQSHNCDGCNPATVNGAFVHEQGCPEAWRDKPKACLECGNDFYSRYGILCDSCQQDEYDDWNGIP